MFRTLAQVSVHPRRTMTRILEEGRKTPLLALFLLTCLSALFGDLNAPDFVDKAAGNSTMIPITIAALLAGAIALLLIFLLFAWAATLIGRLIEGTGQFRDVRNALAWGLAPIIWALVYRLPFSLLGWQTGGGGFVIDEGFKFQPADLKLGCGIAAINALLELAVFLWYATVTSRTLAAAHRYSSWQGLATLLLCCSIPVVIVLAAIMTSIT